MLPYISSLSIHKIYEINILELDRVPAWLESQKQMGWWNRLNWIRSLYRISYNNLNPFTSMRLYIDLI